MPDNIPLMKNPFSKCLPVYVRKLDSKLHREMLQVPSDLAYSDCSLSKTEG